MRVVAMLAWPSHSWTLAMWAHNVHGRLLSPHRLLVIDSPDCHLRFVFCKDRSSSINLLCRVVIIEPLDSTALVRPYQAG